MQKDCCVKPDSGSDDIEGLDGRGDKMERELILKALTDPAFRRSLEEGNAEVDEDTRTYVLAAVKGINTQVAKAPDELLCAYGPGPCGIC
jgi:hypothetical protein